jgi:microsomal epoxide hydrolase
MANLGFESGYVAQGGDIGAKVARILAVDYDACKGKFVQWRGLKC